ncbi:glycosyltransferase [uncultured Faecalibaculum sp.]|uniref:glycosyltransferase n=1 Tax=uncultured Faecalibaculum sp. TaxID=1729681 RepID=UPI0026078744|nr:glycosyltransferase [uncultured Faecalibaculum sp.]
MKILIITPTYYPYIIGGGEYSTQYVAEGLAKLGHDVWVYSLGLENEKKVINGVHIIREYMPESSEYYFTRIKGTANEVIQTKNIYKIMHKQIDLMYSPRIYKKFKSMISTIKPDCLHSVSALSYMGRYNIWKAAYDLNVPVSHVARSPELVYFNFAQGKLDGLYRRFSRKSFKYVSYFAAPTNYILQLHNKYGIAAPTQTVIKNCVRNIDIIDDQDIFDIKENRIIYAGDIREEKGIKTLLKSFHSLSDSELLIIGEGKISEILESQDLIHNDKVQNRIRILPWLPQEELFSIMKKSKVVVLPSEWEEAFGRVLIESIFNGTIAIGSDRGGIPEVLHYDNRFLFKSKSSDELAKKLTWILEMCKNEYNSTLKDQQVWLGEYNYEHYIKKWSDFFTMQIGEKQL